MGANQGAIWTNKIYWYSICCPMKEVVNNTKFRFLASLDSSMLQNLEEGNNTVWEVIWHTRNNIKYTVPMYGEYKKQKVPNGGRLNASKLLPNVKNLAALFSKLKIEATWFTTPSKKIIWFTKIFSKYFKRIHLIEHINHKKRLNHE